MICELCHGTTFALIPISKQLRGHYRNLLVCPACKEQHERELEMCRQNFQRQFGDR